MKIMRLQVLLIAAATLLLAGCGGKSANNKADAANDSGKTATTADALTGVDDEGVFTISSNAANCIFKTAAGYTVFLEDLGEEGTSVYFLRQAGDKLVKENKASFVCLPN
jgi:ABC-type glycerol-3-phosphate transport system substrate-binding protein